MDFVLRIGHLEHTLLFKKKKVYMKDSQRQRLQDTHKVLSVV